MRPCCIQPVSEIGSSQELLKTTALANPLRAPCEGQFWSIHLIHNVTERINLVDKDFWVVPANKVLQSCHRLQCPYSTRRVSAICLQSAILLYMSALVSDDSQQSFLHMYGTASCLGPLKEPDRVRGMSNRMFERAKCTEFTLRSYHVDFTMPIAFETHDQSRYSPLHHLKRTKSSERICYQ